jgi:hypothetical protein
MTLEPVLPPGLRELIDARGPADLVVGIPSCNNAGTIGEVVRAVQAGLAERFPGVSAVIVNADGGSTDGTPEAARAALPEACPPLLAQYPVHPVHRVVPPYHGVPGKGSALGTVFAAAGALGARACAVVEADLRSLRPEWMERLLAPVLEGFDFVAPLYLRHKFDGTINTSIVYPLTRALYGWRIRQPIGGDFGCSGRFVRHCLGQPVWEADLARFGIDAWVTTTAVTGGFRVCQSFLGAKVHDAKAPDLALAGMLHQVVGSLFELMESHEDAWQGVRGSAAVPLFGVEPPVGLDPVRVDAARMVRAYRRGVRELEGIWSLVLGPEAMEELRRIGVWDPSRFLFPEELWVRVVYDFAVAFHRGVMDRQHLLEALTPLYLGWVASFVGETRHAGAAAVAAMEERMCLQFEAQKPELSGLWSRRSP